MPNKKSQETVKLRRIVTPDRRVLYSLGKGEPLSAEAKAAGYSERTVVAVVSERWNGER